MAFKRLKLEGKRFERLTVVDYAGDSRWNCVCECGEKRRVKTSNLRNGNTKSCGCLHRELASKRKPTLRHGMSRTRTHGTWAGMLGRCTNKNHPRYARYGGRGITVCERWETFENFFEDMGEKPKGLTIERIDNDGNYEPGNCRWATQAEQARNRRSNHLITIDGVTKCLAVWARHFGVPDTTVYSRLAINKSYEEALGIE
jgi:hypothetical protein